MKNLVLAASTTLAIIALLLSVNSFFRIRSATCQRQLDRCIRQCDETRDRALGENQLRRNQIDFDLQLDLRDCRINNIGSQQAIDQCQQEKIDAANQELAQLDTSDNAIRATRDQCVTDCDNQAKQCDANFGPQPIDNSPDLGQPIKPSSPIDVGCLEGGAPCFKKVLEICTKISGPCDECWKSLCGGGDWSFESSVSLEVTLVAATDPAKNARVLATSSLKGKEAVLSVPTEIKLNKREQLFLGFSSKEKPGGPVKLVVRRRK